MVLHPYLKPEYIEDCDGGRFVRTLLSRCILVLDDVVNSFDQPSEEGLVQSLGHSISVEQQLRWGTELIQGLQTQTVLC